jgi:hypothetical protein
MFSMYINIMCWNMTADVLFFDKSMRCSYNIIKKVPSVSINTWYFQLQLECRMWINFLGEIGVAVTENKLVGIADSKLRKIS